MFFITLSLINNKAYKLTNKKYNYNFNYYIGDAFKLDLYEQWKIEYVENNLKSTLP